MRIVIVYRNGQAIPAYGDTVIKDGDRVYSVNKSWSEALPCKIRVFSNSSAIFLTRCLLSCNVIFDCGESRNGI
jgi:NhaP-type Na+/H+ and K+/H+ antiporter